MNMNEIHIKKESALNPHLFEVGVEQVPIRKGYGEGLLIAGEIDERVVALCADLTESTQTLPFATKFPKRFVEMGVAEQNLAAVASGMAAVGKIPFITSYAMFSPGRNWEQIRTTICYNDQNVKVIGSHAGVSVGPDGGTHQAIEDIAITRVMPRMTVIAPCDALEARKATVAAAKHKGPVYIRLAREKSPLVTTEDTPFMIGKAQVLVEPVHADVLIVSCGVLVYQSLLAARTLLEQGIQVSVLNMHTIKPFDGETLLSLARAAGRVVTVEEHQMSGGLGGAVSEFLSLQYPLPVLRIGVPDQFGQSGTPQELLAHFGLDAEGIVRSVADFVRSH